MSSFIIYFFFPFLFGRFFFPLVCFSSFLTFLPYLADVTTLSRLRPGPLSFFITLCADSVSFLRTMSRILSSGSVCRAMSDMLLRPVMNSSEPTVLKPCHSKGSTNEGHSPSKIMPIPWPRFRIGGYCILVLYHYRREVCPPDVDSTVPADP